MSLTLGLTLPVPVDSVLLTVEQGSGWFREMAIFLWSWGKGATKLACHKWGSLFGANSACITYHMWLEYRATELA